MYKEGRNFFHLHPMGNTICGGSAVPCATLLCTWIDGAEPLLFPRMESAGTAYKLAEIPFWSVPENVHQLQLAVLRHYGIPAGTQTRFNYNLESEGHWLELTPSVDVPELFRKYSEFALAFVCSNEKITTLRQQQQQ